MRNQKQKKHTPMPRNFPIKSINNFMYIRFRMYHNDSKDQEDKLRDTVIKIINKVIEELKPYTPSNAAFKKMIEENGVNAIDVLFKQIQTKYQTKKTVLKKLQDYRKKLEEYTNDDLAKIKYDIKNKSIYPEDIKLILNPEYLNKKYGRDYKTAALMTKTVEEVTINEISLKK